MKVVFEQCRFLFIEEFVVVRMMKSPHVWNADVSDTLLHLTGIVRQFW